jgi:diaminopimelate epimerase
VGADGVLLHSLAPDGVRMRLINADGGEVELSGNGLRCLAGYMVWSGVRPARHVVHTVSGPRPVEVETLGPGRIASRPGSARPSSTARTSPSPSIRPHRGSWITR